MPGFSNATIRTSACFLHSFCILYVVIYVSSFQFSIKKVTISIVQDIIFMKIFDEVPLKYSIVSHRSWTIGHNNWEFNTTFLFTLLVGHNSITSVVICIKFAIWDGKIDKIYLILIVKHFLHLGKFPWVMGETPFALEFLLNSQTAL